MRGRATGDPRPAMSPSRRADSGVSRSAEQRERDRRERERRRARRENGGAEGAGAFDSFATGPDPTVSRPPDLDWPLDFQGANGPPVPIEWDGPRGPVLHTDGRHLVYDPDTGSQVFVSDEPRASDEGQGYGESAHHDEYHYDGHAPHDEVGYHEPHEEHGYSEPHDEPGQYDAHAPREEPPYDERQARHEPTGYEDPRPGHGDAQDAYPSHPSYAPHPGYGRGSDPHPGYGDPAEDDPLAAYPADQPTGRPDGRRPGRRGLKGRLPSVSLPSGRPTLPAGLAGIGDRLSGLRGARAGTAGNPTAGADPAAGGVRGSAGRGRSAAGVGAASRASSLRRSLDPRTARRSPLSDPTSRPRNSRLPSRPRGRLAAIGALLVVVLALWFLFSLFQPLKGSGHGQVEVVIPAGAGTSAIGSLLAKDHVISSSFFFKLRVELSGKRGKLESGRYVLKQGMSYGAAVAALTGTGAQPAVTIKVTIPEGFSRVEIAAVAKKAGVVGNYVAASAHSHVLKPTSYGAPASVHSLEGFLFPDTYDLLPGDPVSKLINEQLVAFKQQLVTVDLSAAKHLNLTAYDVIKIASMVERETSSPRERPLIAAVIYNRLKANMTLGIDATLRYALNDFDKPLTDSQLASKSPYNTRLHRGLPPTPIGNPGLASLEAAAHPAKVSYLYYVVKPGTCSDVFSTTFAQFEHDSAVYNAARAADNGRSPTTCSG
jgi:UPF0755 protein